MELQALFILGILVPAGVYADLQCILLIEVLVLFLIHILKWHNLRNHSAFPLELLQSLYANS